MLELREELDEEEDEAENGQMPNVMYISRSKRQKTKRRNPRKALVEERTRIRRNDKKGEELAQNEKEKVC